MEVGIILGHDVLEQPRPSIYKTRTQSGPFAFRAELKLLFSGRGKKETKVCHFAFADDVKLVVNFKTW